MTEVVMDKENRRDFERLLNWEEGDGDNESVNFEEVTARFNVEGIFDDENPPKMEDNNESDDDDENNDLMCLDSSKNRDGVLKKLGNSKHKPFDKKTVEDGFLTGKVLLLDIKRIRIEEKRKEKRKIDLVLASVASFKQERNKRRKIMLEQKEQEKSGDIFKRPMMDWENEYIEYSNEISSNINN